MSHLDDGQLHMILDGALELLGGDRAAELRAHLEECPDCRARLEAESELRVRAHDILKAAAPGSMELPSLEELRKEAAARKASRPKGRLPRGIVLAWAASVVLALGAGLYGPELWRRSRVLSPGVQLQEAPSPQGRGDRQRVPEDAGPAGTDQAGASEPEEKAPGVEAVEVSARPAEEVVPRDRASADEPDAVPAAAPERARSSDPSFSRDADEAAGPPVEGSGRVRTEPGLRDGAPEVTADFRRAREKTFLGRGDSAVSPLGQVRLQGGEAPEPAGLSLPTRVLRGEGSEERAVPGLEVLAVEELPQGIVRIRQALPGGDTLIVVHVPLTAEAFSHLVEARASPVQAALDQVGAQESGEGVAALQPLPDGWSRIGIQREGLPAFVILQAPRTREFLLELAHRLR